MYVLRLLLKEQSCFWGRVKYSDRIGQLILYMVLFIVFSSSLYGYVLASWRSPLLGLYVAVKLPILMLGTTCLVMLLNWMSATALKSGMSFKQVVALTYSAMGVTCLILLSLIPVTAFFTFFAAPANEGGESVRLTHNCLLLVHIALIGSAGLMGNRTLLRGFSELVNPGCSVLSLYWSWLIAFMIVGCQLSWMLRPFIGSPFFKVQFLRDGCLERNFFEFIFVEVIPYVIKGG